MCISVPFSAPRSSVNDSLLPPQPCKQTRIFVIYCMIAHGNHWYEPQSKLWTPFSDVKHRGTRPDEHPFGRVRPLPSQADTQHPCSSSRRSVSARPSRDGSPAGRRRIEAKRLSGSNRSLLMSIHRRINSLFCFALTADLNRRLTVGHDSGIHSGPA